ncbi:protein AIR2-like [Teleopsis dalmanni]|uniref:protein AIR2-like n=1 Tax=Teleopsis dalmanni TaxID=139649 RepID=UPI0018CE55FE|nr:protein AIR2-like [Teleopsis dalmanni]XP_037930872.1 protein AIR2-like [Teleopsis dalmanni]
MAEKRQEYKKGHQVNFNHAESEHRSPVDDQLTCTFCRKKGHVREECRQRKNTPYCVNCGDYGHEIGPKCANKGASSVKTCSFCKKIGHEKERCFKRLQTVFCKQCQLKGHEENQFCFQKAQQVARPQRDGRNYQNTTSSNLSNFTTRNSGLSQQPNRGPNQYERGFSNQFPQYRREYRQPQSGRFENRPPNGYTSSNVFIPQGIRDPEIRRRTMSTN